MRIVICEDSVLLREGLVHVLDEGGHRVTAAVGTAPDLIEAVEADPPDLVMVDVRLPPNQTNEGVEAALTIRRSHPDVAVLVVSQYVEERYAVDLIGEGARGVGYLLKERVADVGEFLESVRRVGEGGTAIDPEVISQLLGRRRGGNLVDSLTARELDVLALMAQGGSNAGIAEELVLTLGAVEKHVSSIFAKLHLTDTAAHNRRVQAVLAYLGGRTSS